MADPTPIRPGAFDPDAVAPGVVIDPDKILENHKGRCRRMVLVYLDHDDNLLVAGSHDTPDSHVMLHMGMLELVKLMTGGGLGGEVA